MTPKAIMRRVGVHGLEPGRTAVRWCEIMVEWIGPATWALSHEFSGGQKQRIAIAAP